MRNWLVDRGNGVLEIVESSALPAPGAKQVEGELFTNDETLQGIFPEVLPIEDDKKTPPGQDKKND